jgi:hypothetical protein
MFRRGSLRVLKWTGTIACILIVVAGVMTLPRKYLSLTGVAVGDVGICGGAFIMTWGDFGFGGYTSDRFEIGPAADSESLANWRKFGLWPARFVRRDSGYIVVPLWIPLLMIGLPTCLLWRIAPRRARAGHCPSCNYNLTANTSARCPECGATVAAATSPPAAPPA